MRVATFATRARTRIGAWLDERRRPQFSRTSRVRHYKSPSEHFARQIRKHPYQMHDVRRAEILPGHQEKQDSKTKYISIYSLSSPDRKHRTLPDTFHIEDHQ